MTEALNQTNSISDTSSLAGDHTKLTGFFAKLYNFINATISGTNLNQSYSTLANTITGDEQTNSKTELEATNNLSGNNAAGAHWDGTTTDCSGLDPDTQCPGLQYYLTHTDTSDGHFSSMSMAMQQNIANVGKKYDNIGTNLGTIDDTVTSTVSALTTGTTSFVSATDAILMDQMNNANGIRIN